MSLRYHTPSWYFRVLGKEKHPVRAPPLVPRPTTLPYRRMHALSVQDLDNVQQPQCLLFRLPREIRDLVYSFVFEAESAIHIANLGKRLGYVECPDLELDHLRWRWAMGIYGRRREPSEYVLSSYQGGKLLALLKTCKIM